MIDLAIIQTKYNMDKREEYLKDHKYKIWQGKNGYWYTYVCDNDNNRKLLKKKSREEIDNAIVEFSESLSKKLLGDVFEEWNERRYSLGQISGATHTHLIYTFNRFLKDYKDVDISKLDTCTISEFLEEVVSNHDVTAKAFANLKCLISGVGKYARRHKYIDFRVADAIEDAQIGRNDFKKQRQKKVEAFDRDELALFMQTCMTKIDDLRYVAVLLIMISGIRLGEACVLKISDFISPCEFTIQRTQTKYKENGVVIYKAKDSPKTIAGIRNVVIPDNYSFIYEILCRHANQTDWAFPEDNSTFMRDYIIRKAFYNVCEECNLEKRSPHDARRTYASLLLNSQVADEMFIIEQLGHCDISITKDYYHRNVRTVNERQQIVNGLNI